MQAPSHLVIPFAACLSDESQKVFAGLKLPNLRALLAQLTQSTWDIGTQLDFSPPHERALAHIYSLNPPTIGNVDGQIPWGALHARRAGLAGSSEGSTTAWAVITPCHWSLQTNHIVLPDPSLLQLQEDESRALLATMAPYFADDGITLLYERSDRWLAQGEVFRNLATASLDRAIGRNIHDWLPQTPEGKNLRRLQNEMQMLLYTHPVNDARSSQRQDPVSAFWVSGTGALPAQALPANLGDVCFAEGLRSAALHENWTRWGQAWQAMDATLCATLRQTLTANKRVQFTLCGERSAVTLQYADGRPWERVLPMLREKLGIFPAIYQHSLL